MTQTFWEELVGSKICGGYLLRDLISDTEGTAVYRTSYGEARATIRLIPAEQSPASVPEIDHPHIISVFASGGCNLNGSKYRYLVSEEGDENLGTVIAHRALSPEETREMLGPVLDALAYLHDRGLAHGAIKPSNILAKGDSVKLSSDSVRPVGAVASPGEDLRALGLTIIEVLKGQRQPSAVSDLPQPFRDIAEHLLETNPASSWTARQAALRLAGKVAVKPSPLPPSAHPTVKPAERKPVPNWVYVAVAAVAIGLLIILVRMAGSSSEPSVAASVANGTTPSSVSAPAAPPPPGPPPVVEKGTRSFGDKASQKLQPNPPKPSALALPASPPAATPPAGHGWFVVVASYAREADAKQEANDLGGKFPKFKLSVFPPSPIDSHYVVIIGSGLSQEGADSLRQRAVASGLPADTYIKKYPSGK